MLFKELKKTISRDEVIFLMLKKKYVEEYEDIGRGTKDCFKSSYDNYGVLSISSSTFDDGESWIDSELVITVLEEKI